MPSAQQHLPPETSKGTGASFFNFSNPLHSLSDFVVKTGRPLLTSLASAIPRGRTGEMVGTKPGNVGAPQPINTLSNNSVSSRTPLGISSSARFIVRPPVAKRQKLDESHADLGHTRATFAVIDESTPTKRSLESVSATDSQRSIASNMSASQTVIPEYRFMDRYTKSKRSRKNRDDSKFPAQEDIEATSPGSFAPPKNDEDISEDEVDFINPPRELADPHQLKRKQPEEHSISEFANRFQHGGSPVQSNPSQMVGKIIDKIDKKAKRQGYSFSPDELAPSEEELAAIRPTKRQKTFSNSLSKRGDIIPTKFKGISTARPSAAIDVECQQAVDRREEGKAIIGDGLRIVRGASGRNQYQAEYEDDPTHCFLSIREIGHTLFPVDENNKILKPYRYLTLDVRKANTILLDEDNEDCCIVIINSGGTDLANGAGPRLMIEFASAAELTKFSQWVALYKGTNCSVTIKNCKRAKLEQDFDELMRRAPEHRIRSDLEIETSMADDIRVMEHNRDSRSLVRHHNISTQFGSHPKLREAMKSAPTSRSNGDDKVNDIASGQAWDDQLAIMPRQTRTTRSTFAYHASPEPGEPEPIPEGWTSLHSDWEKQWRNSLVYPSTGKNRATIDKDDIQRLDEGQFLNDNIIIFYLRYLQKTLEEEAPDLARRIYFQNTFFYDKLKPTKNGQGINYDSVKTWTSKVDLFSKDYIIVPINEYTHWYVAIICNAPKLDPRSNHNEQDDDSKNAAIAITDVDKVPQGSSQTPTRGGRPVGEINGEHVGPSAPETVVESLRRMSMDSPVHPSCVTKHKADTNAQEGVSQIPPPLGHEVFEIKDSDRPEAEVEHIATAANPQTRRKTGKRQSAGPRRYNPSEPRIITLDSLGASHSPTCSYLKQYLIAELKDKKGVEIPLPGAMGTTAKDVPEQTNHCDCGLFLLGYIQEFLRGPDQFIKCLLHRDKGISWEINPSQLRNDIRDLIFKLQREQQDAEDIARDRKRQAKKQQTKTEGDPGHTVTPAMNHLHTPSETSPTSQDCRGNEGDKSRSPQALPHPRPSISRTNSTGTGKATDPTHLPVFERGTKLSIADVQPPAPSVENDGLRLMLQEETEACANVQEHSGSKASPHVAASPRNNELKSDHEIYRRVPGTFPISPIRSQAAKGHSTSPGTDGSSNLQNHFLAPLASETPSSKGSRGATPLDPVFVDDPTNDRRDGAWRGLQRHRVDEAGHLVIVEIPSKHIRSRSPGQGETTVGQKQTGQQSPYFLNRRGGERVISAKLREKSKNDVIDLSGD
ncbi:hypothetical protein F5Y09DRAFT_234014 [Xylaria sp. FL1042]|nr:hypothetical protein F5Y09DRAFT_234014 [Xylaria sp. FL1042]